MLPTDIYGDVNTSTITAPSTDYSNPGTLTPPPQHRHVSMTYDAWGRVVEVLESEHSVRTGPSSNADVRTASFTVYTDGVYSSGTWSDDEVWTATGYLDGTTYNVVGGCVDSEAGQSRPDRRFHPRETHCDIRKTL